MDNRTLEELLNLDSLDLAEKLTGKSYKDDERTVEIGVQFHIANSQAKKLALEERDDTTFCTKTDRYIRIAEEEGFRKIMDDPFEGRYENKTERNLAFWHDDGLLLRFDTFRNSVNGGKVYFNWSPNPGTDIWSLHMSHSSFADGPSSCDIDCREALRFQLASLREKGHFCNPWTKQPFLWLLHYRDTEQEGYDHKAITESRLAKFPDEVKRGMGLIE